MRTRTIKINERLYQAIKRAAKKNGRTIRAQAEYFIELGMYFDLQLRVHTPRTLLEGRDGLVCLSPKLRKKIFAQDIRILLRELTRFAKNPNKEGAMLCRAIIAELEPLGIADKRVGEFLERAYQTVARPYKDAPRDIMVLKKWFLAGSPS